MISFQIKIKEIIGFEKVDNTKVLIDTNDKLSDLENVVILMTCVIKDDIKFCPQIFLEEAL